MATLRSGKMAPIGICKRKHVDLIAEELERLITQRNLKSGDKLPQGIKLQETFGASRGTIHETLESLEVRGPVSMSAGPIGDGTIVEVPLDRTFQLMRNYLLFKDIGIVDVYTVRYLLESELTADVMSHLTEDDFRTLGHIIDLYDPASTKTAAPLSQHQEDLSFYDILVTANPNPMLRFCCELTSGAIWQLVVFSSKTSSKDHAKSGASSVRFHRQILDAARARDADTVCALIDMYMGDCTHHITHMGGRVHGHLVLDSEMSCYHRLLVDNHDNSGHGNHSKGRVWRFSESHRAGACRS